MNKEAINEFDEVFSKYAPIGKKGHEGISILFFVISLIGLLTPLSDGSVLDHEDILFIVFFTVIFTFLSMAFYMTPALTVIQDSRRKAIYPMLRYTPCDRKMFIKSRLNKMIKRTATMAVIALAVRALLAATGIFGNAWSMMDVLIVFVGFGIIPFVTGCIYILVYTRK